MTQIDLQATEAVAALDLAVGRMAAAAGEVAPEARARMTAAREMLAGRAEECRRQIAHSEHRLSSAAEEDDTSELEATLAGWRGAAARVRRWTAAVDGEEGRLSSLSVALDSVSRDGAGRAKGFLAHKREQLDAYSHAGGGALRGAGGAEGAGTPGLRNAAGLIGLSSLTGYIRAARDAADKRWADVRGQPPADLPARVSVESLIGPASDQGDRPHCVCHSASALHRERLQVASGRSVEFDPAALYARCKTHDGVPGAGTTLRCALSTLHRRGATASDGVTYHLAACGRLDARDEMRHALSLGNPVAFGVAGDVGDGSQNGAAMVPMPSAEGGGHCVLLVGYDDALGGFRVRNSWGTSWGDNGHCWLSYAWLEYDLDFEAWTTLDAVGADFSVAPPSDVEKAFSAGRQVSTGNYAWILPSDVSADWDPADLQRQGISREAAADTLARINTLRPRIPLADLRAGPHTVRHDLERLTDGAGARLITDDDLAVFDLYFGVDAIRIDSDGDQGLVVVNGRHRLAAAQALGGLCVPVSLSNSARRILAARGSQAQDD